jgi:hypothetical protein
MDKVVSHPQIYSLKKRINIGISKFFGLIPVYGVIGAIREILKNLFWLEITYRFRKDITIPDNNKIQPKIPIQIMVYDQSLDLANWPGKQEIIKIRGEYGIKQFQDRLDEGDLLFCAYSEEVFTGFIWLTPPNYSFSGITLNADENYHIDGWVFERFRGNNILPVLQLALVDYLRKERPDIHYLVSHGAARNKATLAGQQKAGLAPISRELSIFLFGYNKKIKLNDVHSPVH